MFSPYLRRIVVDILLFVSLCLAIYYCKQDFIDFLISLFHFDDKVNVSSVAYIAQRASLVLIPLIMLTNNKGMPKRTMIRALFFIIGICYFLGNTWIISYLIDNSFSKEAILNLGLSSIPVWNANDAVYQAKAAVYAFQYNNAYVFNYINWDAYNLYAILYSTIMGVLYIRFALGMNDRMKNVFKRYVFILILFMAIPLLHNVVIEKIFMYSGLWTSKNILLLFSMFLIAVALKLSTYSVSFWNDVI